MGYAKHSQVVQGAALKIHIFWMWWRGGRSNCDIIRIKNGLKRQSEYNIVFLEKIDRIQKERKSKLVILTIIWDEFIDNSSSFILFFRFAGLLLLREDIESID